MFARYNGQNVSIEDYDPMFRNLMERGQKLYPELFAPGVFIGDFSLRRIPRCGATTEAENKNVDTVAIKLIHRWRRRGAERGT